VKHRQTDRQTAAHRHGLKPPSPLQQWAGLSKPIDDTLEQFGIIVNDNVTNADDEATTRMTSQNIDNLTTTFGLVSSISNNVTSSVDVDLTTDWSLSDDVTTTGRPRQQLQQRQLGAYSAAPPSEWNVLLRRQTIIYLTLRVERQRARMSKITYDGLTRSDTRCFIAVPIWQQWASKG